MSNGKGGGVTGPVRDEEGGGESMESSTTRGGGGGALGMRE